MTVLIQPPPRIRFVDERGNITRPWSLYLDSLFTFVGGATGSSQAQLQAEIDAAEQTLAANSLGVFGRQVQMPQEPPDVAYLGAFLPRHVPSASAPDDASAVICGRVFGNH